MIKGQATAWPLIGGWHELHVYHEAVKGKAGMCSNTLRWNGYRHDHASGGDMMIQPDQERRRHVRAAYLEGKSGGTTSIDASGRWSV